MGRIPTWLSLPFWCLDPFLKAGVILANLKGPGNFDTEIA